MDCSSNLQKQSSFSFNDGELYPLKRSLTLGRLIQWRRLWRRILRKKRGIFDSSSSISASKVSYDFETYAQNFDEGEAAVEPENLSRSFSARFAAAPELLTRND